MTNESEREIKHNHTKDFKKEPWFALIKSAGIKFLRFLPVVRVMMGGIEHDVECCSFG